MVSLLKTHLASGTGEQIQRRQGVASRKQSGSVLRREPYLAVIHRLDQPVEGLLVFAKTPAAARELNRQLTSAGFGNITAPLSQAVRSVRGHTGRLYCKRRKNQYVPHLQRKHPRRKACQTALPDGKSVPRHFSRHLIGIHLSRHRTAPPDSRTDGSYRMSSGGRQKIRETGRKHRISETLRLPLEFRHPATGKSMVFELP